MTVAKLTKTECAALEHRLTCDGLIEVTVDEGFTQQEVEGAIDAVSLMVALGELNDDEGAARGAKRVLNSLAAKLESIGLDRVSVPSG